MCLKQQTLRIYAFGWFFIETLNNYFYKSFLKWSFLLLSYILISTNYLSNQIKCIFHWRSFIIVFSFSPISGLAHADQASIDHHNNLHHHHPHPHLDRSPPSPIPVQMSGEDVKIPEEYEKKAFNIIESRDQGCAEFEHKHEEAFGCINIWLKNRFRLVYSLASSLRTDFNLKLPISFSIL